MSVDVESHHKRNGPAHVRDSGGLDYEVMGPDASLGLFFFFLSPVFSFFSENHLGTSSVYSILQISTPSFLESEESSVVK